MNQASSGFRKLHSSYGHVLKYTGIFGGVQGLKILMDVCRNKLTSELLGKLGMGLNAIFQNIAEQIHAATNFGLSFSSVRRLSELYEEGTEEDTLRFVTVIRTWCLWSSILGAMLCVVLFQWLNDFYFSSGSNHRWEIVLLSLFIASLPIETGECSILKGLRRLRTVAVVEVYVVVSMLLCTIPVYFLLGTRGVVLSLVLCGWAKALLHLYFTVRICSYRVSPFSRSVLREGWPLMRVGIPYVLAAVAGAFTTGLVFKSLHDESVIGLYRAAYSMMVSYAGMVFVAVEADYFPRLSSVNHDKHRMNFLINQQIDVCVLLMAPLLIAFVLSMGWIVRLLYAADFIAVVPMAQCAVFYMFFKAVTTPIAYIPLAKGHSVTYLVMECVYNIAFLAILYFGFHHWGLLGAGLALSVAALFDLLLISSVYGGYYGFRLRLSSARLILPQGVLLLLTVLCALGGELWLKYCVGVPCLLVSLIISWRMLSHESVIVQRLKKRLHRQ